MPVTYVCKRCGYVLYRFDQVGQDCYGLPSPSEVISMYGGICPRCKADLTPPRVDDIIEKIRFNLRRAMGDASASGPRHHLYSLGNVNAGLAETA